MTADGSRRPREAKARQLYAELRRLIEEGKWPHGHAVPSQEELKQQFGMSVRTVRDAVIWLEEIGRVLKSHGRRTRVYMPAESPHRLVVDQREPSIGDAARVAEAVPAVSFVPAHGAGRVRTRWDEGTFTVPEWDRLRLGIDAGTGLLTRTLTLSVGDEPVLTSSSLVPRDHSGGAVRWRDVPVGELALAGVTPAFSRAEVHCRIPTLAESGPLDIGSGIPVLAIYRRCRIASGRPPTRSTPACVLVVARADRVHL